MTTTTQNLTLTMERTLAAPPDRVYRAWTDEAEVTQWIAPDPSMPTTAELDVTVGGAYVIRMADDVVRGVYRELDPGRKLVFTWKWDGGASEGDMLVTVTFEPSSDGGTLMRLVHERLPDEAERNNHEKGWTGSFARLEGYVGAAG